MYRTIVVALIFVAAAAIATAGAGAASTGAIDLRITYRAAPDAAPKVFTLTCNPARGTTPSPATACRRLQVLGDAAFAPTPRNRMCTQVAGGPMTAVVTGSFLGRRIWVRLTQLDGCAIARWKLVSFLLPGSRIGVPIGG